MGLVAAFAQTFQVTQFDILYFMGIFVLTIAMYYFWPLQRVYSIAFGAIIGIGIYVLLSVLLLGNGPLGSHGGLFPFGFSVVIVSIAIYAVFVLALIFPLHGGLVISETTNQIVYVLQYIFVGMFLLFGLTATMFYMIEQTYIFQVGTIFTWFRDSPFYQGTVRSSTVFGYMISHQDTIIPLAVLLMLYKLFLSNIVSAVVLSIVYNLAHIGFYRKTDDHAYRVEFHEVGATGSGHNDHAVESVHNDHASVPSDPHAHH